MKNLHWWCTFIELKEWKTLQLRTNGVMINIGPNSGQRRCGSSSLKKVVITATENYFFLWSRSSYSNCVRPGMWPSRTPCHWSISNPLYSSTYSWNRIPADESKLIEDYYKNIQHVSPMFILTSLYLNVYLCYFPVLNSYFVLDFIVINKQYQDLSVEKIAANYFLCAAFLGHRSWSYVTSKWNRIRMMNKKK